MAENDDPVTPDPATPAADGPAAPDHSDDHTTNLGVPVPPAAPGAPAAPAGPRLRDTVWNFRSMVAVAVASLLIGGAGGAAIVGVADHGGRRDQIRIADFGGMGKRFRQGMPYGGNGVAPYGWEQDGPGGGPGGMMPGGPGFAPGQGSTPSPSAPQSGSTG